MESRGRTGLVHAFLAYVIWGVFPLYFPLLEPAGSLEILAQRMSWSLLAMLVILACTRGFAGIRAVLGNRRQVRLLTAAAILVGANWGTYIWAVNNGHVIQASLGYFINPLVTILLGVFVLRERLRPVQWAAVAVATAAILVIALSLGSLPWIALTLAGSFGAYGLCKKQAGVPAVESLAFETGVLVLPALATLAVIAVHGQLAFGHHGIGNALLLISVGPATVVPLLLFASGALRLPLSALGMVQYVSPVLQLSVGVWIRGEPLPGAELAGFALVWVALILLTVDGLRRRGGASGLRLPAAARSAGYRR